MRDHLRENILHLIKLLAKLEGIFLAFRFCPVGMGFYRAEKLQTHSQIPLHINETSHC